ncbi:hypothetical protein ACE6H2_020373 [Prunus campanulata]
MRFLFEEMWTTVEGCQDTITHALESKHGTVVKKLKAFQGSLWIWNNEWFELLAIAGIVKGITTVVESLNVAKISDEKKQQCLRERREKDKAARVRKAEEKHTKAVAGATKDTAISPSHEANAGVEGSGGGGAKNVE